MEVFDNLEAKLSAEHLARTALSLENINKMKTKIESDQIIVKNATIVNCQISDLNKKVAELKTSKDYVSEENLKDLKMGIEIRQTLVDNLILVHQQIQLMQTNPDFLKDLKEDILVSLRNIHTFIR